MRVVEARVAAEALPKNKCTSIIERSWNNNYPCGKPVHPEAALMEKQLCGTHLRVLRREEAAEVARAEERQRQRVRNERAKLERDIREKAQDALQDALTAAGVKVESLSEIRWGRHHHVGEMQITLMVDDLCELLGLGHLETPREAWARYEREEEEAKPKVSDQPAPF